MVRAVRKLRLFPRNTLSIQLLGVMNISSGVRVCNGNDEKNEEGGYRDQIMFKKKRRKMNLYDSLFGRGWRGKGWCSREPRIKLNISHKRSGGGGRRRELKNLQSGTQAQARRKELAVTMHCHHR